MANAWFVFDGRFPFSTIPHLPIVAPAIANKTSFSSKTDLFNEVICVFSSTYKHLLLSIFLFINDYIFINFIPYSENLLGVVPFVIKLQQSPNLIKFQSSLNSLNLNLGTFI